MASITKRLRKDGTPTWRVMWRERGRQQSETFVTEGAAKSFRGHVDAAGQRWPDGWVPGVGFTGRHGDDTLTVREWCERAIAARTGIEERTRDDYHRQLARHAWPVLGDVALRDLTTEAAGLWLNGLARAVSPKTAKNIHGTLSSLLADAVHAEILRRNPLEGLTAGRVDVPDRADPVFLSRSEFTQLLDAMPAEHRPLVLTLATTGMRWSEATALTVRDVDPLAATVSIRRAWKRQPDGSQAIGTTKTRTSVRVVDIDPATVDALAELLAGRRGGDYVFTAADGGPVRHSNFYNRVWARAVDAVTCCPAHRDEQRAQVERPTAYWHPVPCGCPGYLEARPRVHDLRHSHASWLLASGQPIHEVGRRLGHTSIQTTVNVYGHLERGAGQRSAAVMAQMFAPAAQPVTAT